MQNEKDSMSISLAASEITWSDVRDDAKKEGHNTVASYVQKLLEWNHKEIKRRPYYRNILKLAIVLCIILIAILLMVRF